MQQQQKKKRRNPNLSKYDAPLIIQYKKGYNSFFINSKSPYHLNTMQHREWQRGWNDAYTKKLKKVKNAQSRKRSQRVYEEKKTNF